MKTGKKKHIKRKSIIVVISLVFLFISVFLIGYIYSLKTRENINIEALEYFKNNTTTKEFGKTKKEIKYSGKTASVILYPTIGSKKLDSLIKKQSIKIENKYFEKYKSAKISFGKMKYYLFLDYETYYGVDHIISVLYHASIVNQSKKVIEEKIYTYHYSLDENDEINDTYIFIDGYEKSFATYLKNYYKDKKDVNEDYEKILENNVFYPYVLTENEIKIYVSNQEISKTNKIEEVEIPYEKLKDTLTIDTTKKEKTLKLKNKKEETFKEINKKIYITHKTNIYEKNDKNSKLLGTLKKGDFVEQLEVGTDKFIKIKYNDKECYILKKVISEKPITKEGYKEVNDTIILSKNAIIYESDSENSKQLAKLDKISSVSRIGIKGDWNEIIYNESIAFIKSSSIAKKEQGKTLIRIDPNRKIDLNKPMVALTFDDGPNPSSTNRILDTLEKYNSVATFFDLASLVESYPNIAKREEKIGCEVGSHTYSHANLTHLSSDELDREMKKSTSVFKKVLGHDQVLVRAPYGSVNKQVRENVNYPLINWDIDTLDWQSRNKNSILNEVRKIKDYDGRIILMHSIYETTADAVEELVPELINKGYQLVTISELAKYKGYDYLNNGTVYYSFK